MDLVIRPAQGTAKVYRKGGRVLMYVAKVNVHQGTVTITPRHGASEAQLALLKAVCTRGDADVPCQPESWNHGPDGWTTHVSLPVPFRARPLTRQHPHRVRIRRLLCAVRHRREHLAPAEEAEQVQQRQQPPAA